jgi:prolipoprotein diacylglyceryltransferase
MIPLHWSIGGIALPVHGLLEIAGCLVGVRCYAALRRRRPDAITTERRTLILVGAALGALLGSRLLEAAEHPAGLAHASLAGAFIAFYQGKTIVGGLLGGLIGVEAVKAWIGEQRRSGDLFVYPLLIAIMVGLVGCLLAGVADGTAGRPSSLPWAFDQGDGVPRHPTALYEILFLALLWAALRATEARRPFHEGALFACFLSAYLAWRLGVEFLKPVTPLALGLSAIQWACVAGLLHYLRLFAFRRFAVPPPILQT